MIIKEYTSKESLRPDDKGFAAQETAGRRVGVAYREAAQDIERGAKDVAALWDEQKFGLDELAQRRAAAGGGFKLGGGNDSDPFGLRGEGEVRGNPSNAFRAQDLPSSRAEVSRAGRDISRKASELLQIPPQTAANGVIDYKNTFKPGPNDVPPVKGVPQKGVPGSGTDWLGGNDIPGGGAVPGGPFAGSRSPLLDQIRRDMGWDDPAGLPARDVQQDVQADINAQQKQALSGNDSTNPELNIPNLGTPDSPSSSGWFTQGVSSYGEPATPDTSGGPLWDVIHDQVSGGGAPTPVDDSEQRD